MGKKGRRGNGGSGRKKAGQKSSSSSKPNEQLRSQDYSKDLNTFFASCPTSRKRKESLSYGNIYADYKDSTNQFIDALKRKVNRVSFETTQDIIAAVEVLPDEADIEKPMLDHLRDAILLRTEAKKYYELCGKGSDRSHEYFIEVLIYCWHKINTKFQPRTRKHNNSVNPTSEDSNAAVAENRFSILSLDDDLEEEIFASYKPSIPISDIPEISLDDLNENDDMIDVAIFVGVLDECMDDCAESFRSMKGLREKYRSENRGKELPAPILASQLLRVAIISNETIRFVKAMERHLADQHPHLNTIYRILAALVLKSWIVELAEAIKKDSPSYKSFKTWHAIEFLGDAMEAAFRKGQDDNPPNKRKNLVANFCKKWNLPQSGRESKPRELYDQLYLEIVAQTPMKVEMGLWEQLRIMQGGYLQQHTWLKEAKWIGGSQRCILSTIRLTQVVGSLLHDQPGMIHTDTGGLFGVAWNEEHNLATKIPGDLDEFLIRDVLLLLTQVPGMNSSPLFESELLLFFSELKYFVRHPDEPVSWSLSFAVHVLLTSILETQGNGCVQYIAETSQAQFRRFEKSANESFDGKAKSPLTGWIQLYKPPNSTFAPNVSPNDQSLRIEHAVWNPLCASTFLLYLTYFQLVGLYYMPFDLRIVLHLFNAFKKHSMVANPSDFSLLFSLDAIFQNNTAIWGGQPPPDKGDFVFSWWKSLGESEFVARQRSEIYRSELQRDAAENCASAFKTKRGPLKPESGKLSPVDASKSFHMLCFESSFQHQHLGQKSEIKAKYLSNRRRTNEILTVVLSELSGILSLNWAVVHAVLLRFICELQESLGWGEISPYPEGDKNYEVAFIVFLQKHVLGGLDLLAPGQTPNSLAQLTWLVMAKYFTKDVKFEDATLFDFSQFTKEGVVM